MEINNTIIILLSIWVIIGTLVLIVGVINSLSINEISNAIQNNSTDFKTTWDIIKSNWDIVASVLIMLIMFCTIAFQSARIWYKNHLVWAIMLFLLAAIISTTLILVKRLVINKKKSK
ncbi:MAG: hypothetical protein CME61_09720 [Halobacteriovoraceae bacterium]|nr:hypothetical protein [Halobacteriovoraceae bacterium]|tara:strand:+ start:205 stop:558 length:354 start_codon:yes stop_codon:yes gene_type:complete